MNHATFIVVALLAAATAISLVLQTPLVIVVALLLMPNVMQALPWGLMSQDDEDEDPEYNKTGAGFIKDKD